MVPMVSLCATAPQFFFAHSPSSSARYCTLASRRSAIYLAPMLSISASALATYSSGREQPKMAYLSPTEG